MSSLQVAKEQTLVLLKKKKKGQVKLFKIFEKKKIQQHIPKSYEDLHADNVTEVSFIAAAADIASRILVNVRNLPTCISAARVHREVPFLLQL